MSRRKKVTIIVLVASLLIFGLFLFLEFGEQTTSPDQPEEEPIFPFATTSDFFAGEDTGTTDIDNQQSDPEERSELWKITDDPVAGSGWISTSTNNQRIWFIKQANGIIFSANPETRDVKQLTDTEIPQVREALIGPAGRTAVYRYLDEQETIQTYKATISTSSENANVPYSIEGKFLPTDIYEIALSPDGSQLFYLQEVNNQSVGILYNVSSDSQQQVFSSDIGNWRINFNKPNTVTLYTPPADDVTGYGYKLNLENGQQNKITDGTALALKGGIYNNNYLKTTQDNNSFITKPLAGTTSNVTASTFSEKCDWADENIFFCGVPENTTPTSITAWYQGQQQFQDNLYVFNTETNNRDSLFSSEQIEQTNADMIDISINDSFRYSIFTDRTTGDLWEYDL